MAAPKRGPRLGSGPAHQKQLLANLASDLFRHGRIRTTETKAKTLRPYAEKLITKAKAGDLHARRQVLSKLHDRDVVAYLFDDVGPRFAERDGGYTRILKLGPRAGDNASMAIIELVEQSATQGEEVIEEGKQRRSRGLFGRGRRRGERGGDEAATGTLVADADVDTDADAESASADSPESPASPASPESPESPESPASPASPDSPEEPAAEDEQT